MHLDHEDKDYAAGCSSPALDLERLHPNHSPTNSVSISLSTSLPHPENHHE
jgi:hypothetical protein